MYFRKKSFSIRVVSFVLLLSLNLSIFSFGDGFNKISTQDLLQKLNGQDGFDNANKNINKNGDDSLGFDFTQELKEKLDTLRVEQILDSALFLKDESLMIGDNEWDELELDNVLENWQVYTKTKFDMWGIKKLLKHAPQGSKEIIRLLVENDEEFERFNGIMDAVKESQDALIAYWDDTNLLHHEARGLYYSIFGKLVPKANRFLNKSTVALEFSQIVGILKPAVTLLATLGISGIVNGFITSKLFGIPFNWKRNFIEGLKAPLRAHDVRPAVYKNGYDYFRMYEFEKITLGDQYVIGKNFIKRFLGKFFSNDKAKSVLAGASSATIVGGLTAWGDYNSYSKNKDAIHRILFLHKTSQKLQGQLVSVANLLKSLENLSEDLFDIDTHVFAIENIKNFINKENTPEDVCTLFNLLNSDTFKEKVSFCYSRGCLLNTHRLFGEIKDEIVPLLQNIALLGGCRAIAQMVREHRERDVTFCFVQLVDKELAEGPFVSLKNAWIPLISEDNIVANDVVLGAKEGARCAVVTGPNGGGKSTFMITVAFNILLSRLGIAAADEAHISSFEKIRTSLRPQQDIKCGLSAFMAEHKRVAEVKKSIDLCDGNILVLLDEPYKGTVEVESATRVYKFGKEIAIDCPNCMLLLATHLRKPIELEAGTGNLFTNYQMGYVETKSAGFKRTFKVCPGPAIWWFDDADKRARFIDWLCSQEIEEQDLKE